MDLLLRYWVARWGGFWNATFQPTSEWEEGYREEEILRIGQRLAELDGGRHLISVHSLKASRESVQRAGWYAYHTVQDKLKDWNFAKYTWLVDLFRHVPKPILAHECLWEGNLYQREAGLDVDNLRRAAWVIALSGGQINYADEVVPPRRYQHRGDVNVFSERGLAMPPQGLLYPSLAHLARFMRSLPFWRLTPHPEWASTRCCLAEKGERYVAYAPKGGALRVNLTAMRGPWKARWFDPREGKWEAPFVGTGGREVLFHPPDEHDWVLVVERR